MKILCIAALFFLFSLNFTLAQAPYTDYIGAGHAADITTTFSADDETATGQKTIDGSGLTGIFHSSTWDDAWLCEAPENNHPLGRNPAIWIMYDFGHVYSLGYSHFWNSNEGTELTARGFRNATFEYSVDGTSWQSFGQFELQEASGSSSDMGSPGPDFGGIDARYLLITMNSTWGEEEFNGFAEMRINVDGSTGIGSGGPPVVPTNSLEYQGLSGIGAGKHIVFVTSDHEYRSEETLPALARILAQRHGFKCSVLFGLNALGQIEAGGSNIPGLEKSSDADLMVIATRFADPSDEQMAHIESYLDLGKPVVGLRTASHGFVTDGTYAKYNEEAIASIGWEGGFGRHVLGNNWADQGHYGPNFEQATQVQLEPSQNAHPILQGVGDNAYCFAGAYGATLRPDFTVLAHSQPLLTMDPSSGPDTTKPPVPNTWIRNYQADGGAMGRVFYSSQGASQDILDADYRRLVINGILWAVGCEDNITPNLNIDFVGPYTPSSFAFGGAVSGVTPADLQSYSFPIMPGNGDPELIVPAFVQLQPTEQNGGATQRTITITNTGATQNLAISGVSFSGTSAFKFSNATFPASLSPGQSGDIQFTFTPGSTGLSSAVLTVSSNAQSAPSLDIPISIDTLPPLIAGVTFRVFQANRELTEMPALGGDQTPNIDEARTSIDYKDTDKDGVADGGAAYGFGTIPPLDRLEHLYCEAIGLLNIENPGPYDFRLTADDGAELRISGMTVINNSEGERASPAVSETTNYELAAGLHNVLVKYWNGAGSPCLKLEWKPSASSTWSLVSAYDSVSNPNGWKTETYTRVVSPGDKLVYFPSQGQNAGELTGVHPGYDLFTIAGDFQAAGGNPLFNPPDILITGTNTPYRPETGAIGILSNGKLLQTVFSPSNLGEGAPPPEGQNHRMYAVTGAGGNTIAGIQVREVANGFNEPLGMCIVNDIVYVAEVRKISRLEDLNNDGDYFDSNEKTDLVPVMNTPGGDPSTGWYSENFHNFTFGLVHAEGWLYGALSASLDGEYVGINAPNSANRGTLFRVNIDANNGPVGHVEYVCGGLRTPNGVGMGPEGKIFATDNQGSWNPDNSLYECTQDHFYGHYNNWTTGNGLSNPLQQPSAFWDSSVYWDSNETPVYASAYHNNKCRFTHPAVYLRQNEMCNSPTDPVLIGDQHPAFKGQMFIGEHRNGGIRRAFLEKVNGRFQGAAFRFTQGLSCGANALRWGPDGALYLGGTGGDGNWKWRETTFGLERLKPNGTNAFEIQTLRAISGGFLMTMTKPVSASILENIANYFPILTCSYPSPGYEYGVGKVDGPNLTVTVAEAMPDGRSVKLTIPGIVAETVLHLRLGPAFETTTGEPLWSGEAYYTMNALPNDFESEWAEWINKYYPGSADLETIGPKADPENDRRSNLMEFVERTDPTKKDPSPPAKVRLGNGPRVIIETEEMMAPPSQLAQKWFASQDLKSWSEVTNLVALTGQVPTADSRAVSTYELAVTSEMKNLFLRRSYDVGQ
ncbi:MAG: choice-of-anchor D domain-containing protein [Verrucomicrobiota bacterium]